MLLVLFRLGNDCYAIDAREVIEVLPLVNLKKIPQAPVGVAGAFVYRSKPVPVIDLSALALCQPSRAHLSTRIILVNHADAAGERHILGLMAEQATETIKRAREDFVEAGVSADEAPYLGPVVNDPRGLIQLVEPRHLLTEVLRESLFRQAAEV